MKSNKPINKIEGRDWQELVPPLLNKEWDSDQDDEIKEELARKMEYLQDRINSTKVLTNVEMHQVKIFRQYIKRLAKNAMAELECGPIYKGLSECKTWTMLQYSAVLLRSGHLWC